MTIVGMTMRIVTLVFGLSAVSVFVSETSLACIVVNVDVLVVCGWAVEAAQGLRGQQVNNRSCLDPPQLLVSHLFTTGIYLYVTAT